jgi:hypothetical protein
METNGATKGWKDEGSGETKKRNYDRTKESNKWKEKERWRKKKTKRIKDGRTDECNVAAEC